MDLECVNISIDLTNREIVARYIDDRVFRLKTDLYTISDFDLIPGTAKRLEEHIKRHFSTQNSRPAEAFKHITQLSLRNGCFHKFQRVS